MNVIHAPLNIDLKCIIIPGILEYHIYENKMNRHEVKLCFKMKDRIF